MTVGIVTVALGCDNVSFGGMSISLEGPPRDSVEAEGALGEGPTPAPGRIEYGPLLYAGVRDGDSARVVPVAELVEGRLAPLPVGDRGVQLANQILEERFLQGQELTAFHGGTRIGTLTLSGAPQLASGYCAPRPQVRGHLELVPSAAQIRQFLALEGPLGRNWPFHTYQEIPVDRDHRNAAQNLAGEALNQLRAQWPTALQNIRRDLQAFQLTGSPGPSVVSTFLFQDQLEVGPAPEASYSLLIIGEPRGNRFERTFTWYRRVGEEGKGSPRFFSWMDWDQDGEDEVLLEVFGGERRWWAALEREGGGWSISFQEPCGRPAQPGADPAGGTGADPEGQSP
jgi:hypothetical protein